MLAYLQAKYFGISQYFSWLQSRLLWINLILYRCFLQRPSSWSGSTSVSNLLFSLWWCSVNLGYFNSLLNSISSQRTGHSHESTPLWEILGTGTQLPVPIDSTAPVLGLNPKIVVVYPLANWHIWRYQQCIREIRPLCGGLISLILPPTSHLPSLSRHPDIWDTRD